MVSEAKTLEPVSDDAQPNVPVKVGIALSVGALLWLSGYVGTLTVLLPAKIAAIDDSQKATLLATVSSAAMVVATLANIILGAFSDMTRSRLGRRTPWLLAGSVGACIMLLLLIKAHSLTLILVVWLCYQVFLNAIVAPMVAIIADRVAPRHRGIISSFYAIGISLGMYGGTFIAAQFIHHIDLGLIVMAVLTLCSGGVCSVLAKEGSSLHMAKQKFDAATLWRNFSLPTKNAGDYYLALLGKLMLVAGTSAVSGMVLYILTDYAGVAKDGGDLTFFLSAVSMIMMITAIVMSASAGYLADKVGRIKAPVLLTCIITSAGLFFPFISSSPWMLLVYAVLAGLGYGAFQAVDQALNVAVLPNMEHAAKDLGILNLSNTLGQIMGPVLAAAVISLYGYRPLFLVAAVITLMGTIFIMLIKKVR
ncbi:MFS transporter [uncultured Klebsiella sp.]|uniref:MFS transporter n=1 Tax=uncultured Klebsiella sp. TaxID=284011 RepID=UPI00280650E9|nr:MFS transporter [uncultured Klebsiella sp.]